MPRDVNFRVSYLLQQHLHTHRVHLAKHGKGMCIHIGVGSDVVHSSGLGNARALCRGVNNR